MRNTKFIKYNKKIHVLCGLLCLLTVIIDQAVKLAVLNNLTLHTSYKILPFLNFFLTFNSGVSFSMLNSCNSSVLILISCLCLLLLIWGYVKFKDPIEQIFLALLIGGATGNFIDRFTYGAVVDFIDVYMPKNILQNLHRYIKIFSEQTIFCDKHFPTFNIADSFITIGTAGLILYIFFKKDTPK